MTEVAGLLYVIALILFLLAGFGVSFGRSNLGPMGLACWLLASHILPLTQGK